MDGWDGLALVGLVAFVGGVFMQFGVAGALMAGGVLTAIIGVRMGARPSG